MGEVALNLLLLLLSLGLAIVGAFVGAWLQHRSWIHQNWQRIREEKTRIALATVEDAAKLVDRRLYRQRRLLWSLQRRNGADTTVALKDYQDAVAEWMDNLGRLKAELWLSFDRWTAIRFEEEIHDPLARVGRQLERSIRSGLPGALATEERELNRLGRSAYEFIHALLERISSENLNGLVGRDELSYRNWENLSVGFLTRRLFGLPA
jgi:hypothetical protein